MIPRGAPYISWSDLLAATLYCLDPGAPHDVQRRVEMRWAPDTVAFLSVRSGLDALLHVLALPPESEVIVSAITIPHIVDILTHHRLIAVPVDIDLETLAVRASAVRNAITSRTKAIVVAHLFGSRMPLDEIAAAAREHRLVLLEDCAQSNDGSPYRGHAESTACMFSFGAIKRQTALGGGLLRVKDAALAQRLRERQASYPVLPRTAFLRRVMTMVTVKCVVNRTVYRFFVALCRAVGRDHDRTLGMALRGFTHGDLFARLRQHPGTPLLRLLERRLHQSPREAIARRMAVVETVTQALPELDRPGRRAAHHSHWLFPMLSRHPDQSMHRLWAKGFDATRGASNLICVPAPAGRPPATHAVRLMTEVVYLPLFPTATDAEMREMAGAIREIEARA